ncbi:MAG: EFR1 family ferrodoxin [Lachnospiraceae bacterium]|nr:EFR1 family ferrodoxin [Lachnospiraceae bacterium]
MIGIYLSGTGNTKHCVEKLLSVWEPGAEMLPIEDERALEGIRKNDGIVLAYPTQFSNIPYLVRDFINTNRAVWKNKSVFCLTTMGMFSGDGTGCAARLLKKYGATVTGGLQVKMPDSVCDSKLLKKTLEENQKIIREADRKLENAAKQVLASGTYPKEGLGFAAHLAGLFGQRLWFYNKTTGYSSKLKISDACTGCGLCVKNCPTGNLTVKDGKAVAASSCTMCYRCISSCPKQAVTLLGKQVHEQCRYEKYSE